MNNVVAITLCLFCFTVCAQNNNAGDNNKFLDDFRGTASITHNGVSLVPSFSLGDPALLFDLKFRIGSYDTNPLSIYTGTVGKHCIISSVILNT